VRQWGISALDSEAEGSEVVRLKGSEAWCREAIRQWSNEIVRQYTACTAT
jgi:hypothetical protein